MGPGPTFRSVATSTPVTPRDHSATIAPVIIATDKTALTNFSGGKSAYPVYLTLGNILKAMRKKVNQRACVLLGYLPVDKVNKGTDTDTELKLRNYQLFHDSMRIILEPLIAAGLEGVNMVGGDGIIRKVHPILAAYVADYPEQCLVTLSKYGTCPKCQIKAYNLGDRSPGPPKNQDWTVSKISEARKTFKPGVTKRNKKVHQYCMKNYDVAGGMFDPFWKDLPFTNIHDSVTPDALHQLYQGVLVHIINWVQKTMSKDELDRRAQCLPPTYGVRHFRNGITSLKQVSGSERKNIGKILLACLGEGSCPDIHPNAVAACKALLDFIYLALYGSHDEETLTYMEEALNDWHKSRSYFLEAGIRDDLNIPKFHSLLHYINSIQKFGTIDNYNTELFERLHIDFAKQGWRASNKRNHFPQMIQWLSRREKILSFNSYQSWLQSLGDAKTMSGDTVKIWYLSEMSNQSI
ncbi:hypothetical protein K435DRAFT_820124 [Dendrothele bispora CBS 962.96]|uniref:Uncharacterized protein n=1 Tax=Dendrothele bispora (strain CBS 962.96) TaxID=1314807 RepID=A0A4S8LVX4_DENBC|nr:hypothetical protein K435DRAFT_820124 [Dendrothele bispora CBS 962.96]